MFAEQVSPITGVLRWAPTIDGVPAACMWRLWIQGDDIYALNRNSGEVTKLSVHFTGQIHMSLGESRRQELARLIPLDDAWSHAFEWRFLLSADAFRPPPEKPTREHAYFIRVPPGQTLILSLIVARSSTTDPGKLPAMFDGKMPFWEGRLKSNYPVALVAYALPMDEESITWLRHLRYESNLKVNPTTVYFERQSTSFTTGGNIMFVVPMGAEVLGVADSQS
jgi:hypothetical protein